jgi:DNA mismatch repair ATPase MutS
MMRFARFQEQTRLHCEPRLNPYNSGHGDPNTNYIKALQILEAAQLHRVGRMIQEIVDIDNSEEQGRTVVKQGLDRELDRMKDRYDGLNSLLKNAAIEIATTIPGELDIDVNVIYFPQLGFNIAIPLNNSGDPAYSGTVGDWEMVFTTETKAYFKDFRMRELDERLGDIYGLICGKFVSMVAALSYVDGCSQRKKLRLCTIWLRECFIMRMSLPKHLMFVEKWIGS